MREVAVLAYYLAVFGYHTCSPIVRSVELCLLAFISKIARNFHYGYLKLSLAD